MSYATPTDLENRYPSRDLVQLTDPNSLAIQTAAIAQALGDASCEIDSYLESRFALPLADPPAILNRICCDIAMYRMQPLRPLRDIEDARVRYDDAIKVLVQVRDGDLTLGLSADNKEPPPANPLVVLNGPLRGANPPSTIFNRRSLRSF